MRGKRRKNRKNWRKNGRLNFSLYMIANEDKCTLITSMFPLPKGLYPFVKGMLCAGEFQTHFLPNPYRLRIRDLCREFRDIIFFIG
jgi:hypothetical protein